MNAQQCLMDHYTHYDEDSRLLSRHGQVEYLTTLRYIEKYLHPGCRVLEIGAGTGRYSHTLGKMGYAVDAVELVPHNIDIFLQNQAPEEQVTIRQGTATDLSAFADNSYDITLLLGPMYHLFTPAEQQQALREAVRVTKKGGVIFAAYCMSDATVLSYCFIRGMVHDALQKGMLDPVTFRTFSRPEDIIQMHRREDIDGLRQALGVKQLHFVATDGFANFMRDALAQMDEATYQLYLRYHLATCERQDMTGNSHHTLDIFRKL